MQWSALLFYCQSCWCSFLQNSCYNCPGSKWNYPTGNPFLVSRKIGLESSPGCQWSEAHPEIQLLLRLLSDALCVHCFWQGMSDSARVQFLFHLLTCGTRCAGRTADATCSVSAVFSPFSASCWTLTFCSPACFSPNQIKTSSNLIQILPFFSANQITHMLIHMCTKCAPMHIQAPLKQTWEVPSLQLYLWWSERLFHPPGFVKIRFFHLRNKW